MGCRSKLSVRWSVVWSLLLCASLACGPGDGDGDVPVPPTADPDGPHADHGADAGTQSDPAAGEDDVPGEVDDSPAPMPVPPPAGSALSGTFRLEQVHIRRPGFGFGPVDASDMVDSLINSAVAGGSLNLVVHLQPSEPGAHTGTLGVQAAQCLQEAEGAQCSADPASPDASSAAYSSQGEGLCLEAAGVSVGAPCLVSTPAQLEVSLAGISLSLLESQLGVGLPDESAAEESGIESALLVGFLDAEVANSTVLPELPGAGAIVSGLPLSALLSADDLGEREGVRGWWFAIEVSGARVPWDGA